MVVNEREGGGDVIPLEATVNWMKRKINDLFQRGDY